MKHKNSIFAQRTVIVFILLLVVVVILIIRLLQLQIFGGEKYKKRAAEQRVNTIQVKSERGIIYDRNKKPIVTNISTNSLYVSSGNLSDRRKERYAEKIGPILQMSKEEILELLTNKNTVKLYSNLTAEQIKKIHQLKLTGISVITEPGRNYPREIFASSLIGFTDSENNGVIGLEKSFNDVLKGKPGLLAIAQSLNGESEIPLENSLNYESTKGNSLVTTIDESIQSFVMEAGKNTMQKFRPKSLSILVMNPNTGEVLAMQDFPGFDANDPRKKGSDITDQSTEEEVNNYYFSKWKNLNVSFTYEPGSVFKVITTASALEENVTSEGKQYTCGGFVKDIPGVTIRCSSWADPHGDETLQEALNDSCNVAYVQLSRELGKEKFVKYISGFGFGQKTNISLLGEEVGSAPLKTTDIDDARLATMSYGHGISTTPIAMLTALNAVVNGGYVITPKIVLEIVDDSHQRVKKYETEVERQVISEKTSHRMNDMLKQVVDEGSGHVAKINGYQIGGKSGTSIKVVDGKYTSEKTVASFFASFPADHPEYTILVVCDEPQRQRGGSAVAGSCAKEILNNIIKHKNYQPVTVTDIAGSNEQKVPDVVGLTIQDATMKLREKGFRLNIINSSIDLHTIIVNQSPKAYDVVPKGSIIELTCDDTGEASVRVPDLLLYKVEDAEKILKELGLQIKVTGEDTEDSIITETNPQKDTLVESGSVVEVKMNRKEKIEE